MNNSNHLKGPNYPAFGEGIELYCRTNGAANNQANGSSKFISSLSDLSKVHELSELLHQTTRPLGFKAHNTLSLRVHNNGDQIIKKISADDAGYMPYGDWSLFDRGEPLMPRIDAYIETKSSGGEFVYVVMESLVPLSALPQEEQAKWPLCGHVDQADQEREARTVFGSEIQVHCYAPPIMNALREFCPSFESWVSKVAHIAEATGAKLDLHIGGGELAGNVMFRRIGNSYEPVVIDPLCLGIKWLEMSPRFAHNIIGNKGCVLEPLSRRSPNRPGIRPGLKDFQLV
jgi:hypothetical protein